MPEYTYDDDTHLYRIDGVIVPSVTQVLSCLSDFRFVDEDVMRRAQAFGKAVHLMAQLYLEGRLDEDTLDEGLRGPLEALKKWFLEWESRLRGITKPMSCVIDIKSRPFDPIKDPLQLAGYALLWRWHGKPVGAFYEKQLYARKIKPFAGTPDILVAANDCTEIKARYVLELKQDGEYVFTNARRSQDDSMFRLMLENWHHQAGFEVILNGWRKS